MSTIGQQVRRMIGHSLQVMYEYDADIVGVTVATDCE